MTEPYSLIDCDTHCYETRESGLKYLPEEFMDFAIQPVRLADGREVLLSGDRVAHFLLEKDMGFDKAFRPGTLKEMLKQMYSGNPEESYAADEMQIEYIDRDARMRQLDKQNVEKCVVFPASVGWAAENWVRRTDALYANIHAFNRWYDETWGFNYKDRIFATPMLSLRDLDEAIKETDYVLSQGARVVVLPTGPAHGRSPSDPYFDPVWSRLNDAGVTVAFHIHEYWYNPTIGPHWGQEPYPVPYKMSAWQWMNTYGERTIVDTLSALIFDNLFGRFPNLRVLAAEWVPHTLPHLDKSRGMGRNGPWIGGPLKDRPSEIFREFVRVVPYPEDDIPKLVDTLGGAEVLVMGSDFPHAEGLTEPRDFKDLISSLPEDTQRMILRDNGEQLLTLR